MALVNSNTSKASLEEEIARRKEHLKSDQLPDDPAYRAGIEQGIKDLEEQLKAVTAETKAVKAAENKAG